MQWKNRIWFVKGDSAQAYYLDVGTFAGDAHPMLFAPRFRYGGSLVGLWSWTLDGGQGVDDLLVAISSGGDVAIYQGSDPTFAETFFLRGVWWVGPVPPGRTIASDFGGDLFILSRIGCLPLSKLVSGGLIRDPSVYETAKITNTFNRLMSDRGDIWGWSMCQHPTDNLFIVNYPGMANAPSNQAIMSLATKGWSSQTQVPMVCMATWRGKLYFGTSDGRVCINDGYTDSGTTVVPGTLAEGSYIDTYSIGDPQEIRFSLLSAYNNLGSPAKKFVHMARPYFLTDGTQPGYAVQARFDFDLTPIATADVPAADATVPAWDVALWDVDLWGSGNGLAGRQYGTTGMGSVIAIALQGTAMTETTLASIDVLYEAGGYL
jgi:hypothetical protein